MIRVEGLRKCYGDVVAVDNVSFSAADGEITGLLGPNGAGKTTSLRMLSALVRPNAGTAWVDDVAVERNPRQAQRRLGVLPDSRGLYTRLTPREHMRYFGALHGIDGKTLDAEIDAIIELLGMGAIADRRVGGFSQGERTKVAIARALVHQPQNVVLDEPTNGLDVMSTRAMREVIRRLRDAGKCVLFSSHIMQEVSALCDHIIVIAGGRVVADGTPSALREQTGHHDLEEVFVSLIGSDEGLW